MKTYVAGRPAATRFHKRSLHEPERSEDRYFPGRLAACRGGSPTEDSGPGGATSDRRARGQCGQATKGVWGMSWRQEATKGAEDCDKSGGAVKRALIPEFPNHHALNP